MAHEWDKNNSGYLRTEKCGKLAVDAVEDFFKNHGEDVKRQYDLEGAKVIFNRKDGNNANCFSGLLIQGNVSEDRMGDAYYICVTAKDGQDSGDSPYDLYIFTRNYGVDGRAFRGAKLCEPNIFDKLRKARSFEPIEVNDNSLECAGLKALFDYTCKSYEAGGEYDSAGYELF